MPSPAAGTTNASSRSATAPTATEAQPILQQNDPTNATSGGGHVDYQSISPTIKAKPEPAHTRTNKGNADEQQTTPTSTSSRNRNTTTTSSTNPLPPSSSTLQRRTTTTSTRSKPHPTQSTSEPAQQPPQTTTPTTTTTTSSQLQNQDQDPSQQNPPSSSRLQTLLTKYGTVELENKGSVARDHLALERTFLAWLRTSLSFASIGIAVTQLFRLNTSIAHTSTSGTSDTSSSSSSAPSATGGGKAGVTMKHIGKPLGATFLFISLLILLIGFHRFFEAQHYVIRGKFPASRGSVVLVSFVAGALIVVSFLVVLVVGREGFEA